jgi:hypothetical protein
VHVDSEDLSMASCIYGINKEEKVAILLTAISAKS